MHGLMMDVPLLVSALIRHADRHHGDTRDRLARPSKAPSTATPTATRTRARGSSPTR